jgi:hypothetical protein
MRVTIGMLCAAVVLSGTTTRADEWVFLAGGASTRMSPEGPFVEDSVEFLSRDAFTTGVRYKRPIGSLGGLALEARLAPRGGGVSFRQIYDYHGDYAQLAPRWYFTTRGSRVWAELTLGPAVGFRVHDSYDGAPISVLPYFGRMKAWELAAVGSAAFLVKAGKGVRVGAEVSYDYGLMNIHEPGSPGTQHDPHVFDFEGHSRTASFALSLGVTVPR